MRKIEALMVMTVRDQLNGTRTKEWRSANTCVRSVHDAQLGPTVVVELHGHEIAQFTNGGMLKITDAGWQTVTTKSRLNALLSCFYGGQGIRQVDGAWLLNSTEFAGTDWVSFKWQGNRACQHAWFVEEHHKAHRKALSDVYELEHIRALSKGLAAATCLA